MNAPRLCIVSPNRNAWSETFIANHIAHLARVDLVLTDGHLPKRDVDGGPLVSPTLVKRVLQRVRNTDPQEMLRSTVARLLKKHRIEAVLAEYGPTGEAMLDVCQRASVPMVVHFHGIDAFHTKLLKESTNYQRIFQNAAALVVVSREMEQQIQALGCPRQKLHYNCYGIEVERFTPSSPEKAPKHFLAVGRFVDKKAPHLTLLAFHKAWQQDNELRLTMAGDGPLWESTQQLAIAQGMKDVVAFPGVHTHDQVAERMQGVRAFVQHSVITADNDHEGTPLSILEAMASALPVIATRHGGIVDVIHHEVEGLLCDERDIDAMSAHMLAVAQDPMLAKRLGEAGRALVLRDHQLQYRIAGLQAIMGKVTRG